jgi:hypothetical protein
LRLVAAAVALTINATVTPKKPKPAKSRPKSDPAAAVEPEASDIDARLDKLSASIVIQASAENLKSIAAEARMLVSVPGTIPRSWSEFAKQFAADILELEGTVRAVESAKSDAQSAQLLTDAAAPVTRVETVSRLIQSHRDGDGLATAVYFVAALKSGSAAAGIFFENAGIDGKDLNPAVKRDFVPTLKALADRGDATAQYVYATECLVGTLTPKDVKKAAIYAAKSAKQGNESGDSLLKAINRQPQ